MPINMSFVRKGRGQIIRSADVNEIQQALEQLDGSPTGEEWDAAQGAITRLDSAYVDVRAFGASVASADNSTAIQAALDYAATTSGRVYVPEGTWVIATKLVVPKGVTLFGPGARSCIIRAGASFTGSMVQLGAETTQYEHNMWVEGIQLDCNERPGVIGVETRSANEPSGLRRVMVNRYRGRAVHVHSGGGFVANCFTIEDCELFASEDVTADESILLDDVGLVSKVIRTTVSNTGTPDSGDRPLAAVRGVDAAVFTDALHVEQHVHGTDVVLGANNKGSLTAIGTTGHHSVDDLHHLTDAAPHTVIQAVTNGADDVVVNTVTGYSSVAAGRWTETIYTNQAVVGAIAPPPATLIDHTVFGIPPGAGELIQGDTSGGTIYLSLPSAVGMSGQRYVLTRVGGDWFSIYPAGGETIGGAGEKNITTDHGSITVVSDGANWIVQSEVGTIT